MLQNPAVLSLLDSSVISFGFTPSKFNLPEISPLSAMAAFKPYSHISFAASLDAMGNNLFKEYSGSVLDFLSIIRFLLYWLFT